MKSLFIFLFAISACVTPRPAPSRPPAGSFGVIVMAHGGSPEWNRAVEETVAPLRERYDIEVAFGMADASSLQQAVRKLEARGVHHIGVVRLFISGESWFERTAQILGLQRGARPAAEQVVHHQHSDHSMAFFRVTSRATFALSRDGLVDEPAMGRILADRAQALSKDPAVEDVLVLAHGPGDDTENARWIAKLDARASAIRAAAPFRRVRVETLREDWPDKRVAAEQRIRAFVARATAEGGTAIVVPFRVQGFGPYATVLDGLDYRSDGQALIPHAEVRAWIERQIRTLAI